MRHESFGSGHWESADAAEWLDSGFGQLETWFEEECSNVECEDCTFRNSKSLLVEYKRIYTDLPWNEGKDM